MKCEYCEHTFNIFAFAYRQIRRCPECGQMYEMKFPVGTGFIPVVLALFISVFMSYNNHFTFMVGASIFILVYYVIDIIFKIGMIYTERYEMTEMHR